MMLASAEKATSLYLLTDEHGYTDDRIYPKAGHRSRPWGKNTTNYARGTGHLLNEEWIHAYTHPVLAVVLAT